METNVDQVLKTAEEVAQKVMTWHPGDRVRFYQTFSQFMVGATSAQIELNTDAKNELEKHIEGLKMDRAIFEKGLPFVE